MAEKLAGAPGGVELLDLVTKGPERVDSAGRVVDRYVCRELQRPGERRIEGVSHGGLGRVHRSAERGEGEQEAGGCAKATPSAPE